jgi:hypothetical protein
VLLNNLRNIALHRSPCVFAFIFEQIKQEAMNLTDFFAFQRLALGIGFFEKQDSEKPSASKNAGQPIFFRSKVITF